MIRCCFRVKVVTSFVQCLLWFCIVFQAWPSHFHMQTGKNRQDTGNEFKPIVSPDLHKQHIRYWHREIHKDTFFLPFLLLLFFFLFFFFWSLTKQNHAICSSNSSSILWPQKGVSFDSGNPGKVTGIKKIEGMSQEDFKLY